MKKTAMILSLAALAACKNALDLSADKALVTQFAGQSPAIGVNPPTTTGVCDQIVDADIMEDILIQAGVIQPGLTIEQPAGQNYCQVNFLLSAGAAAGLGNAAAVNASAQQTAETIYGALVKASHIAATGSATINSLSPDNFQGVPGFAVGASILDNGAVVAASKMAMMSTATDPSFLLFEMF